MVFWNNLEGYTKGMLALAYQSTWNAIMDTFHRDGILPDLIEAFLPESRIAMQIKSFWFSVWVGVVAAGVLAGGAFIGCTIGNEVVGITDSALAAMRLDLRKVYAEVGDLCADTKLSDREKKVRLRFEGGGDIGDSHTGHTTGAMCRFRGLLVDRDVESEDEIPLNHL